MLRGTVQGALALVALAVVTGGGFLTFRQWQAHSTKNADSSSKPAAPIMDGSMPVRLTAQARQNMELVVQPITTTTYWRAIEVPGVIIDRPGVSDRGVIAPITGVVTQILSHPGETV